MSSLSWISQYQLFLFDFDGLLVRTEHIHYQAYMNMLRHRGFSPDWSFEKFCSLAHLNAEALKSQLYLEFPLDGIDWKVLYEEKKKAYMDLLREGNIELMPGVEALLRALHEKRLMHCVVTNSPRSQIDLIREGAKALQKIPHWITREDYLLPKPDPECYLLAIQRYGKKGDRIIGFEDSFRGFQALRQTSATAVLIASESFDPKILHFRSLEDMKL